MRLSSLLVPFLAGLALLGCAAGNVAQPPVSDGLLTSDADRIAAENAALRLRPPYGNPEYMLTMAAPDASHWGLKLGPGTYRTADYERLVATLAYRDKDLQIEVLFLPAHAAPLRRQANELRETFGAVAGALVPDEGPATCRDALRFDVREPKPDGRDRHQRHWFGRVPDANYSFVYLRATAYGEENWLTAQAELEKVVGSLGSVPLPPSGIQDQLAQCLSDKGVRITGVIGCIPCYEQKDDFGAAITRLKVIDCSAHDDPANAADCKLASKKGYPTWIFPDGSTVTGRVSLAMLAEKAGCPGPREDDILPRGKLDSQ